VAKKTPQASTAKPAASRKRLKGLCVADGYTRHPFDIEYDVRTSGLVAGRDLKCGQPNDRHATAYYAVAPSVARDLIARWRRTKPVADIDAYTFVDLGAGMGRAMLIASEYRFRAVVGVELHPTLAGIARRNVAIWRKSGRAKTPLRMHCADAVNFKLPDGPCAIFLFNPFEAPVLKRLLKAWSISLQGRESQVDVLYVNHEQQMLFRSQPGWTRLWTGQVRRWRVDAVAERTILNAQPDGEYAALNWEDCSIFRWTGTLPKSSS
jgi:hypothetical protein